MSKENVIFELAMEISEKRFDDIFQKGIVKEAFETFLQEEAERISEIQTRWNDSLKNLNAEEKVKSSCKEGIVIRRIKLSAICIGMVEVLNKGGSFECRVQRALKHKRDEIIRKVHNEIEGMIVELMMLDASKGLLEFILNP